MNNKNRRMFNLAQAIALRGNCNGLTKQYNVGAIGIRGDGTVVYSSNIPTQFPDKNAHAEARLCKKLDVGATVYVVRVGRDGKVKNSSPCYDCRQAMKYKVKRCFYSISNNEYGVIDFE